MRRSLLGTVIIDFCLAGCLVAFRVDNLLLSICNNGSLATLTQIFVQTTTSLLLSIRLRSS